MLNVIEYPRNLFNMAISTIQAGLHEHWTKVKPSRPCFVDIVKGLPLLGISLLIPRQPGYRSRRIFEYVVIAVSVCYDRMLHVNQNWLGLPRSCNEINRQDSSMRYRRARRQPNSSLRSEWTMFMSGLFLKLIEGNPSILILIALWTYILFQFIVVRTRWIKSSPGNILASLCRYASIILSTDHLLLYISYRDEIFTGNFEVVHFIQSNVLLWRNWLARSAVNRKVGGSSPPRSVLFFLVNGRRVFSFILIYHYRETNKRWLRSVPLFLPGINPCIRSDCRLCWRSNDVATLIDDALVSTIVDDIAITPFETKSVGKEDRIEIVHSIGWPFQCRVGDFGVVCVAGYVEMKLSGIEVEGTIEIIFCARGHDDTRKWLFVFRISMVATFEKIQITTGYC